VGSEREERIKKKSFIVIDVVVVALWLFGIEND